MKKESPENIHQQDVNLREAVARRARKYPQRPQGLDERVMERMASGSHAPHFTPPRRKLWLSAAACVAAALFVGYTLYNKVELPVSPVGETAQLLPQPHEADADTIVPELKEEKTVKPLLAKEEVAAPVRPTLQKEEADLPQTPVKEEVGAVAEQLADVPTEPSPAADVLVVQAVEVPSADEGLLAAAVTADEDSAYQDPDRVNECIARFADYHGVEPVNQDRAVPLDSNAAVTIYVFPDKKDVDVWGRMLQMALWYDNAQPGYHLDLSPEQLFFELRDEKKGRQYRWIAERIEGRILLCCAHSPIGAHVPMNSYFDYRNRCILHTLNTGYYQL
jgi:hypothetical protein